MINSTDWHRWKILFSRRSAFIRVRAKIVFRRSFQNWHLELPCRCERTWPVYGRTVRGWKNHHWGRGWRWKSAQWWRCRRKGLEQFLFRIVLHFYRIFLRISKTVVLFISFLLFCRNFYTCTSWLYPSISNDQEHFLGSIHRG